MEEVSWGMRSSGRTIAPLRMLRGLLGSDAEANRGYRLDAHMAIKGASSLGQVAACWKFLSHNNLVGYCKGHSTSVKAATSPTTREDHIWEECGLTLAEPGTEDGFPAFRSRTEQQTLISYNLNDTSHAVMGQSFFFGHALGKLLKIGFYSALGISKDPFRTSSCGRGCGTGWLRRCGGRRWRGRLRGRRWCGLP